MAFTQTITQQVTTAGALISANKSFSGDGRTSRDVPVADSTTDLQVDITIDVSQIQSIYILSDQDMTLETNNGGAPVDTINLLADQPYIWSTGSYFTNALGTDVTAMFLTNASGSAATFKLEVIVDSTV